MAPEGWHKAYKGYPRGTKRQEQKEEEPQIIH